MNEIPKRNYDYLFKIVMLGDRAVGKTNLMNQFVNGEFSDDNTPRIGFDFLQSTLEINTKTIRLQIWDFHPSERFTNAPPTYYRGTYGIIVVYDVTNRRSFANVDKWIADIRIKGHPNLSILLLGNKCDQKNRRQVSREEGERKAKEFGAMFKETSAKDATNVKTVFNILAVDILQQ